MTKTIHNNLLRFVELSRFVYLVPRNPPIMAESLKIIKYRKLNSLLIV